MVSREAKVGTFLYRTSKFEPSQSRKKKKKTRSTIREGNDRITSDTTHKKKKKKRASQILTNNQLKTSNDGSHQDGTSSLSNSHSTIPSITESPTDTSPQTTTKKHKKPSNRSGSRVKGSSGVKSSGSSRTNRDQKSSPRSVGGNDEDDHQQSKEDISLSSSSNSHSNSNHKHNGSKSRSEPRASPPSLVIVPSDEPLASRNDSARGSPANVGNPPHNKGSTLAEVSSTVQTLSSLPTPTSAVPTYTGPYISKADGGRSPELQLGVTTPRKVMLMSSIPEDKTTETGSEKMPVSREGSTVGTHVGMNGSGIGGGKRQSGSFSLGNVAYRRKITAGEADDKDGSLGGIKKMQAKITYAKALYDYTGNPDKNVLSFKHGAVLEVLIKNESGWWTGVVEGEAGYFPSNFVTEIDAEEAMMLSRNTSSDVDLSDSGSDILAPTEDGESLSARGPESKRPGTKVAFSSKSQPTTPRGPTHPKTHIISTDASSRSGTVIGTGIESSSSKKGAGSQVPRSGSAISSRMTSPRDDIVHGSNEKNMSREKDNHSTSSSSPTTEKERKGFLKKITRRVKKAGKEKSAHSTDYTPVRKNSAEL
eukprot:TRINITY_DN2367_c0_g1_i3.p1 TRINITY_DN2367_c0_g1~~TRINITY_DN2367_c0_g1_i3.p1  ORF type:complete len:592 (-),score=118.38 TRINITY_DN2367_c0_g1_i3:39-1814(-)